MQTSYIGATERIYPVYKIVPLANHLAAAGIAAERTLAGSGISVAELSDPYFVVSRQQLITVFDNFLRLTPGILSPLELGATFQLTDYGIYGYALLSSPTVRDAINFAMTYRELATPIVAAELVETDDEAIWAIEPLPDFAQHASMARFVQEYQSGILVAIHRSAGDNAFRLRSASFGFRAPDNAGQYSAILDCPACFDAPHTELRFDKAWLERRPLGAHALTFQLVHDTCREMHERISSGRGVSGEIYRHLLVRSFGQFASLEEMAAYLELHPRTLRRRLASEGTTYQDIVDEVRFKLASGYLRRTEMTHESIAERLGFSDASSFRRAFRRWAGVSPNAFKGR